jgi:hypothetical protein
MQTSTPRGEVGPAASRPPVAGGSATAAARALSAGSGKGR